MTFTAIDFETANANDPCEIGITRVENGQIILSKSWLIKPACFPYMNHWNQQVHGISSSDLRHAQSYEELWSEIKPYIEDQLVVAHNAAFDMRVLKATLNYYDLALPFVEYFCSVSLSRKVWKQLSSHSLGVVSSFHGIKFNHHRAGDDSRACAIIVLKAFENSPNFNFRMEVEALGVKVKRLL